jgi:hypothetical protein
MTSRLVDDPRFSSLLVEAPAPRTGRRASVPKNSAWFNPQAACWGRYRAAIVRELGLTNPLPDRATLARAVEFWQAAQGLAVDGVMGSRTWERLWTRLGVVPVPAVTTQLPPEGPGYCGYAHRRPHHRFGLPETIRALQAIAAGWAQAHPNGPRIGIGDLSLRGGGPIWGHSSHQCGIDVDILPMRSDGQEQGVRWDGPGYSRALTQELVDRIWRNGVLRTQFVLFNDAAVKGVKPWPNHDNHLHVRFYPPGSGTTEAPDPEVEAITEALGLAEAQSRANVRRVAGPTGDWGSDTESSRRHQRPFPADVIRRVRRAYVENDAAARRRAEDRAACIVMLNIGLGHLLGLRMKRWPARTRYKDRPVKSRTVLMGDLTTETIEKAMAQLQQMGLAGSRISVRFLDKRNRTAGTLAPMRIDGSVARSVLGNTGTRPGWYAFGLSIMDGYHSVLLLVHRTAHGARIYWLDQYSSDINDDVTASLDDRITTKTTGWWQDVLAKKNKRYNTTIHLWRLRNRRRIDVTSNEMALDHRIQQAVRQPLRQRDGHIEPAMAPAVQEWEPDRDEFTPQLTFCQKARLAATAEDDVQARLIEQLKLPIRRDERAKIIQRVRYLVALFEGLDPTQKAKLRGRLNRPDDALARFFDCKLSRGFRKRLRALLESPPSPVSPVPVPLPQQPPINPKPPVSSSDIGSLYNGYENLPYGFPVINKVRGKSLPGVTPWGTPTRRYYYIADGISVKGMDFKPTELLNHAKFHLKALRSFNDETYMGVRVNGLGKRTLHLYFNEGAAGKFTVATSLALEEIARLAKASRIQFRWFVNRSDGTVEGAQFLKDMKLGNPEYAP